MKTFLLLLVLAVVTLLIVGKKNSSNINLAQPVAAEETATAVAVSTPHVQTEVVNTDTNVVSVEPSPEHNAGADDSAEAQANKLGLSFKNAVRVSVK